jgi:hypothetical protein
MWNIVSYLYSYTHVGDRGEKKLNFAIGILFYKRVKIGKATPIQA